MIIKRSNLFFGPRLDFKHHLPRLLTGSDMGLVDCPTVYVLDLWEAE
jgi:hypothetical protein